MGPAAAVVDNLFFLLLATAFFSAAQASENFMAKPSTVWINNAASFNLISHHSLPTRPIVFHSLQDDVVVKHAFGAGFVSTTRRDMFFFAVFYFSFFSDPYEPLMYKVDDPQVTWSANRARPVRENATLEFTSDGNLVLRDADDSHVWSSNSSNLSVASMEITDIGNLVLFDQRKKAMWQSFNHPTDTMVLGQSLVEGMRLTANTSTTNTTWGKFYVTVRHDGLYAYVGSTPPQLYFALTLFTMSQNEKINYSTKVTLMNGSINFSGRTYQYYEDLILLPRANSRSQYMRLELDGHLRLYEYNNGRWTMVADVMGIDYCDYPTACGKYSICTGLGQCTCPVDNNSSSSYFQLLDGRNSILGCVPITSISCQQIQHHQLLTIPDVSYFDKNPVVVDAASTHDCQQACLKDCSCMAVLFRDSKCIWLTEVFSLRSIKPGNNYTAYLKVQISPFKENHKKVIVGATLGGITTLVLVVIIVILYLQKRRNNEAEGEEFDLDQLPGMPTRFSFQMLSECTEGFGTKLGEGGFGSVFEGKLGEEKVAVKRLEGARQGKKEFLAEVETIGSIEHINLVSLIGFCAEKSERLLVYEYMSKGSLDRWIYYRHNNSPLDWFTRSRIILDIAKGLCYLHEQCKKKIAHLDIKPQNILLDDNFNANVADFGLCKLINRDQSKVVTVMRGTPGYLAPEWLTSHITEKVDVYSFGVVVMEIVSGRKNIDNSRPEENVQLINLLREKAQNDQLVDLIDKYSDDMVSHQEEVVQMMKLAIWCLQHDCIQRPSMSTVIKALEGAIRIETFNANSLMFVQDNPSTYSVPFQASILSGPR